MLQTAELRILQLETELERACAGLNTERVTRMRQDDQIKVCLALATEITGIEHHTLSEVCNSLRELFEMKIEGAKNGNAEETC